ncbi:putative Thioesterase domain, HotDog domain superfamily, acyl-coenzyme A thioesterase 13 [Helianthus annuus]|nr:putative Thioesterase domain, HotDog domain superfamily, acyl-coenzyme A thioesterase 13 [Helianthus annuus]KAJ0758891.1 putative Thioesterase domain, HotDog domain superfamily, acyl-coenzyme A thioesterase 13 [Helianthus annuus]KAJ0762541.1 putative Thioesterase domain, HotDog domain superfamily, acyl-coenzyme A thioesterase 13 [Helianthus annuus]KAJ0797613.1 putative Thioesterase domain, HotDog domain superfamily, acyl-coenzyme A thioesterase 13 [Helianthus annuus]KAJ0928404.1 putative Thi
MTTTVVSKELLPETAANVTRFITHCGGGPEVSEKYEGEGFSSDLIRSVLKVQHIHRGRVTCILTVKPYVCNAYNTFHGGAVGSIAEMVALACARTVVKTDKELFLGELSISYLAAAVSQAEVIVDASIVRSGRNLTVVAIEFKLKDSERLNYLCRATFYNMPVASL